MRSIDEGRPFDLLKSHLIETIPPNRLIAIEPPTYGFGSVEAFFDFTSPVLGPFDRWVVPILASPIMEFFWQETTRGGQLATNSHEAFETLGELPVKIPCGDVQDRLGEMVQLVRAASDDAPLALELKVDLEERVYSIYGLGCLEIAIVEG
ncbi:MAG: hypothetical protein KC964_04000, partial [Candidatus Omnitrophica bacterium]|nr:hypothetical protein [Candidatus Omnitrophota bacterium]